MTNKEEETEHMQDMQDVFLQIIAWFTFIMWQWYYSTDTRGWYAKISAKVPLTPPGWLFGVVWPILYVLITAAAVVYFSSSSPTVQVFVVFVVNILLNKAWSAVFFGMKRLLLGAFVIAAMIGTEIAVLSLWVVEDAWISFGLYLPYVVWTVFALYLNVAIYQHAK